MSLLSYSSYSSYSSASTVLFWFSLVWSVGGSHHIPYHKCIKRGLGLVELIPYIIMSTSRKI